MKHEKLTILLFCGFLGVMLVLYLLLPKTEFSQTEKRFLAEAPEMSWDAVASGKWGEEAETYMADHIPGRNFFVGLNAYFELFTGRQAGKDVWYRQGRLLEAPVEENSAAITRNMAAINALAKTMGQDVHLMLVPSAGWAAGGSEYRDGEILAQIYDQAEENVIPVEVAGVYAGNPDYYYKTDHHWTSEGAYRGYAACMAALGREARAEADFEKTVKAEFQGSTYSRSALWLTPAEELEVWLGSDSLTVTNGEAEESHAGVFYWERLEEADKYTVFLDGNHSIVRITNPEKAGRLLVIRDSYSNSLGCFLAESYGEVVLVDLRYYKSSVSELAREGFDDVLVCYSIGNFMTDTNFIFLK